MKLVAILFLLILTEINCKSRKGPNRDKLREKFYWDMPRFQFPPNRREQAIASGSYIPYKNGIHSIGVWQDKIFVGIFRFSNGVVSSLNYFPLNTTEISPVLIPYPSYEVNYVNEDPNNRTVSLPHPSSVINVAHFEIDKCDRLWVADAGYSDQFGDMHLIAPQAIVIFDLITNTLIRRKEIFPECGKRPCILPEIVIDFENDSCEDVHAYIPDGFRTIIVYSFKNDRIWQVEHSFMHHNPDNKKFIYEHIEHNWDFGVFTVAIGNQQPDGTKCIYFATVTSTEIFYVSNRVLQDENYNISKYYDNFYFLGDSGQDGYANTLLYDDKTGVLFNTMFQGAAIGCWNTNLPFNGMDTVHKMGLNSEYYPTDIDIDKHGNIWTVSHLVALTAFEKLPTNKRNMRIHKESVEQSIRGTNCEMVKSKSL